MHDFVSRPIENVTFLKKRRLSKISCEFFLGKRFRKMEIVEDFDDKSYKNNGKPWKSSTILRGSHP